MALTRKHFSELASILADNRIYVEAAMEGDSHAQVRINGIWGQLCRDVMRFCRTENPRFDEDRFNQEIDRLLELRVPHYDPKDYG